MTKQLGKGKVESPNPTSTFPLSRLLCPLYFVLCTLTLPPSTLPAPVPALGDSLLKHGFNLEAGREFRRSLYHSDSSSLTVGLVRLKLGLSLGAGNDLPAAAEELRAADRLGPGLSGPAQTALAGFYARRRRYDMAELELSDLLVFTRDSARRASLHSSIGWLRLQKGDIASAAASFVQAGAPEVGSAILATKKGPLRSPTAAAIFSSVVPGSGEVYAGHPATGLLAFAVTAGSLAGAIWAAKADDWVSASILVSVLFWRFYNGSRSNAIAFTEEFNSASRYRRVVELSSRLAEPDWFREADSLLGYNLRPDTASVENNKGEKGK
jgi:TM2 domain-containing membrane protein YozV